MRVADHQPPSPEPDPPGDGTDLRILAPTLAGRLSELRRRSAILGGSQALLTAVAAGSAVLLVAGLLLVLRQEWARLPGWIGAGTVALGFLVRGVVCTTRRARDNLEAARALGRVHPRQASDLVSAVEFSRVSNSSASLARAHISRMEKVAAGLSPQGAISNRPAYLALGLAAAALSLHVLAARHAGERFATAWRHLAFLEADSGPLFAPEPIAGDIALTFRYPAHMNRASHTVEGTAGDIFGPRGTLVELTARADRDVERAYAVTPDGLVPLTVEGRRLSGSLLITEAGEWRLRYDNARGRTLAEGPPRPIAIEPDAFPEVQIHAPEAEREINPGDVVSLSFSASDDYGLGEVALVFSHGRGEEPQRKVLSSFREPPRRHRGEANWDLSTLTLQPGDRITYHLEVTDNDTVSGPKKGVSPSQVLKVFSPTEHNREILRKAEEQWERLIGGLGDRLEEPAAGDRGELVDEEWARLTRRRDEQMVSIAGGLRELARELVEDERAPQEIARALGHVGSRVGEAAERTGSQRGLLIRRPTPPGARHLREALSHEISEVENGILYLEDLFDRQRLLDLAELSRELEQGRQDLANLVEQFRQTQDDQTRRAILSEVSRLKERMHELFRRMQELSRGLQDEHLNREADALMGEGEDMLSQLDEVQRQLARGDDEAALKALEKLQESLAEMEEMFRQQAGEVDDETREVGRQLQQLASDLLDVEAEQQALRQKTEGLREREKEARKQQMERLGEEFVARQRERVAQAKKALQDVDFGLAEGVTEEDFLQAALDRLDHLDRALEGGDFDEALQQARGVLQAAGSLRSRLSSERDVARQFPGFVRNPSSLERNIQHAQRGERPIHEVAADLEELMESASPPPTPSERQQLQELAQRQNSLEKRTEQLQKRLDAIGEKMPLFGPGEARLLGEAAGQMGEAEGHLGEGDPRGAGARQSGALEKLSQFKQAMRDAAKGGGGSGSGMPMPFSPMDDGSEGQGRGVRAQKVEIPSADQNRAPDAFRRDILDAMKDRTPERYEERVRDYYEELVR